MKGGKKVVLVGANGMLASMVARVVPPDYELHPLDLPEFDLTRRALVLDTLRALRPALIVNCAAYTDVDGCEAREALATEVNGAGPGHLAEAAGELGALLVHLSTDYVFDGKKATPYEEGDPPNPLSAYGRSKLRGEEAVLRAKLDRFLIVRTSWLYGPGGKNFVDTISRLASEREELRVVADQRGSPTYTRDLARALFALVDAGASGCFHYSNEGACSWHEFAAEILRLLRGAERPVRTERLLPIPTEDYPLPAPRPANSLLSKEKYRRATGASVPDWRESLREYLEGTSLG
jgi:dTDP-4-dehydrorhamnose reductase